MDLPPPPPPPPPPVAQDPKEAKRAAEAGRKAARSAGVLVQEKIQGGKQPRNPAAAALFAKADLLLKAKQYGHAKEKFAAAAAAHALAAAPESAGAQGAAAALADPGQRLGRPDPTAPPRGAGVAGGADGAEPKLSVVPGLPLQEVRQAPRAPPAHHAKRLTVLLNSTRG